MHERRAICSDCRLAPLRTSTLALPEHNTLPAPSPSPPAVGVNGGSAPPAVPHNRPFWWRDAASGKQLLAFWHPGGYSGYPVDTREECVQVRRGQGSRRWGCVQVRRGQDGARGKLQTGARSACR